MVGIAVRNLNDDLKRRSGADSRAPSPKGVGPGKARRRRTGAHHRQEPAPKAGRRHRQPQVHPHRASRRLPDAEGDVAMTGTATGSRT